MFLFVLRNNPDMDHIVPIIDGLCRRFNSGINVICTNPHINHAVDYRIKYLKAKYNIVILSAWDMKISGWLRSYITKLLVWLNRKCLPKYTSRVLNVWFKYAFNRKWAKHVLAKLEAKVVIHDYQTNDMPISGDIIKESDSNGIKRVKVPHGVGMRLSGLKKPLYPNEVALRVVPNKFKEEGYLKNNNKPSNLVRIGCARYNKTWQKHHLSMIKTCFSGNYIFNSDSNLKVLGFERSKIGFNSNHPIIAKLKKLEGIEFVFAEKPRLKSTDGNLSLNPPSSLFIDQADVVVMSSSSIGIEVLMQGKPLLYLDFLAPGEDTVFKRYDVCQKISSEQELVDIVHAMARGDWLEFDYSKGVNELLLDVVYGGLGERDVVKEYVDVIIEFTHR